MTLKSVNQKIPFYPIFILMKLILTNGGISFERIPFLFFYIIRYIIFEPVRLLELFIYDKRIRAHQLVQDPIFILGHWRSGTSHLQNLLRQDNNTTSVTIYTSLFADNYYLTESWLKKGLNYLCKAFDLQYAIQRTLMDLNIPGELDTALCAMCSEHSYTWGHIFPKKFTKWCQNYILLNDEILANAWIEDYDYMIRKVSFRSGTKRMIIKSPGDTARMIHLYRKYPKSKFIYIHRDPFELFSSNIYLWNVIQKQNSFQKISKEEIRRLIIDTYSTVVSTYIKQRELIPASQRMEVLFKDIQQDPQKQLENIYSKMQLGPVPEKKLNSFLAVNRSFKLKEHQLTPDLEKELKDKWAFAFAEWPT